MIGKTARFGTSFLGAMEYCYYGVKPNRSLDRTQIRGELLYYQHVVPGLVADPTVNNVPGGERLHIEAIARQFAEVARRNERVEKPVWHQVFSFPVENGADTDRSPMNVSAPSRSTMVRIAQAFAQTFGLANNPMVVFRHTEKDHDHFHIIASRVNCEGQNSAQSVHNYRRIGQFCREMEERFNLTPTPPMTSLQPADADELELQRDVAVQTKTNAATHRRGSRKATGIEKRAVRQAVDKAVSVSGTLAEFCQRLAGSPCQVRLVPYTDREGKAREGITYVWQTNDRRIELPGYSLGRDYVYGRIVERVHTAGRIHSGTSMSSLTEEVEHNGLLHTNAPTKIVDDLLSAVPFAGMAAQHESEIERDIARIQRSPNEFAQPPSNKPSIPPTKGAQPLPTDRKVKRRKGL